MTGLIKVILSLSLSGSLLLLPLLLFRPLYRHRLGKAWQYYIFLVVVARLLLPFSPEASLANMLFTDVSRRLDQSEPLLSGGQDIASVSPSRPSEGSPPNLDGGGPAIGQATSQAVTTKTVLSLLWSNSFFIWLIVASIMLIRKITVYQAFVRYVSAGCTEVSDITRLEQFGRILQARRIHRTIELKTNPLISSPLLIGFYHPCIVLPTADLAEVDFLYTVEHELVHYRRWDMLYKWLVQLTICIHWFNPLVYLLGRETGRACELACDEAVINSLEARERRAYGDMLLNAMGVGGSYQSTPGPVTLHESKVFLQERLDAIMRFQKKTWLNRILSAALVLMLCLGGAAAGAYQLPPSAQKKISQPILTQTPVPTQATTPDKNYTLVEQEYTLEEISALQVSGIQVSGIVVEALSEHVTITRGGDRLKITYYNSDKNDYALQPEPDGGYTRYNLCLQRMTPLAQNEAPRPISVTIPADWSIKTVYARTESGTIQMAGCVACDFFTAITRSGQVCIQGGAAGGFFKVDTGSGNALIQGIEAFNGAYLETQTGSIAFQPADSVDHYHIEADMGPNAQILLNGRRYSGGEYSLNDGAAKEINFESPHGTLILQELSLGSLTLDSLPQQQGEATADAQAEQNQPAVLSQVRQEYSLADLASQGITGIYVHLPNEHIIVSQGGPSLIIQYDQAYDGEYTVGTRAYQLYEEGCGPENQAGLPGTIEQLVFSRSSTAMPGEAPRTVSITLPGDPSLNRVIKFESESGNIQLDGCNGTAYLVAGTRTGNINMQNCLSPYLDLETDSGTVSILLVGQLDEYRLILDAPSNNKPMLNGKPYDSGTSYSKEAALYEIAIKVQSGSVLIQEG